MKLASFFISGLILLAGCQSKVDHELADAAPKGVNVVKQEQLSEYWQVTTNETRTLLKTNRKTPNRGYVVVGYLINSKGNVVHPTILKSQPSQTFDKVALANLKQLHYKPAAENEKRAPVYTSMTIKFDVK